MNEKLLKSFVEHTENIMINNIVVLKDGEKIKGKRKRDSLSVPFFCHLSDYYIF